MPSYAPMTLQVLFAKELKRNGRDSGLMIPRPMFASSVPRSNVELERVAKLRNNKKMYPSLL